MNSGANGNEILRIKEALMNLSFFEFEHVKDRVYVSLVNQEREKDFLVTHPHIQYLDLAIVFGIYFDVNDKGLYRIRVTNAIFDEWGIGIEELLHIALENTQKDLGVSVHPLSDYCLETYCDGEERQFLRGFGEPTDILTRDILTNKYGFEGAVCMIYDSILAAYADEHKSDFCIVPSSKDEVILIVEEDIEDYMKYQFILKAVNEIIVPPEKVLSDNIYIYRRSDNCVHLLTDVDLCGKDDSTCR